jgi:hypothetical protein
VALADIWSEKLELHGRLSSRIYFRSPGLDLGQELHLSSWHSELNLEALLRLRDTSDLRAELTAVLRPRYDAVYDLYPGVWGDRAEGGVPGTGSSADRKRALRGESFPGHGGCISGEFCLGNQDGLFTLTGRGSPGIAVNPLVIDGSGVAPWKPRGPGQGKVGGVGSAGVFGPTAGDPRSPIARSLLLSGTEVPGSAPAGLATPLNLYAGAFGDRRSLDQLPADVNRRESTLKLGCLDGAHSSCWLHELYLDLERGDSFLRLGRQIIAWGKTDSFQLQDIVNPLDEGIRSIFPSLDERRIPAWAARWIYTVGELGPFEDVSVDFVWVWDRFTPRQIGQCGEPYAFLLACELRLDAATHSTLNLGLAEVDERHWTLGNTEPGIRIDFYLPDPALTLSLSAFWGFQDLPVLEAKNLYSAQNPNPAALLLLQSQGLGAMIDLLATGGGIDCDDPAPGDDPGQHPWVCGFDAYAHDGSGAPTGTLAKANEDLLQVWDTLVAPRLAAAPDPAAEWEAIESDIAQLSEQLLGHRVEQGLNAVSLPWAGSEIVADYPRVLTLGGSLDYDAESLGAVVRLEMAYDIDRAFTNTAVAGLRDDSDVFKLAIGIDRPTTIPFLGASRPTMISVQTFWERILDYDDGRGHADGMVNPRDGLISTLYLQSSWRSDRLRLITLVVADWSHQAWAIGPTLRWHHSDHLSFDLGLHILAGRRQEHGFRDTCPTDDLTCLPDPTTWNPGQYQSLNRNLQRAGEAPFFPESFADRYMEERDEVWFGVTWEF